MGPADTPARPGSAPPSLWTSPAASSVGRRWSRAPEPLRRRLAHLLLTDAEPLLYHGESVLHDGGIVGRVASGAYGHTLGAAVGLVWIEGEPAAMDEIVAGRRRRGRDRR